MSRYGALYLRKGIQVINEPIAAIETAVVTGTIVFILRKIVNETERLIESTLRTGLAMRVIKAETAAIVEFPRRSGLAIRRAISEIEAIFTTGSGAKKAVVIEIAAISEATLSQIRRYTGRVFTFIT